jgi:UDP-glucuronate 4-epimerase
LKVLVTGGAGFIGSHLCERLLREGESVVCLDDFNGFYDPAVKRANLADSLRHPAFRLVEGDIRDRALVEGVFSGERPQAVVHLAAMAGVRPSLLDPLLYQDVNVRGTVVLLEAARAFPPENFLFGSSSSVYGEQKKVPFSEDDRVDRPVSPYAATKAAGELLCAAWSRLHGIPVTCLRFFTVYGPRQRPEMAIHRFARLILEGKPIQMYGDGTSRRDYSYIDDIIEGLMRSLRTPFPYEIINLGESRMVGLSALIRLLEEALGAKAVIERQPVQSGDVPVTCADIGKARRLLGYDPHFPVERGIELFARWLLEHRRQAGRRG